MKKIVAMVLVLALTACSSLADIGTASIHSPKGSERHTASGQIWQDDHLVAAHKHYPLGSYVRVVDVATRKSVDVQIIDRGPYVKNRVIDLSKLAANHLGLPIKKGTLNVRVIKL